MLVAMQTLVLYSSKRRKLLSDPVMKSFWMIYVFLCALRSFSLYYQRKGAFSSGLLSSNRLMGTTSNAYAKFLEVYRAREI